MKCCLKTEKWLFENINQTPPIFLSSFFTYVSFRHVKKQGNYMAHKLARRAIFNPFIVWMKYVPPDTLDVYNFDLQLNA